MENPECGVLPLAVADPRSRRAPGWAGPPAIFDLYFATGLYTSRKEGVYCLPSVGVAIPMNWNIFYAVAICTLTVLVAGLAGHLAATKSWHKWVFWGGGLITVILVFFQAHANEAQNTKNDTKQEQLQEELKAIKKQLSAAKVGLFAIGLQPAVQRLIQNKDILMGMAIGVQEGTAKSMRCNFVAFTLPGPENPEQNRVAISRFREQIAKESQAVGDDKLAGTGCFKGLLVKLNESEIKQVVAAKRFIYMMGHAEWKNESGADFHVDYYKWMEPPKSRVLVTPGWHDCVQ
jgi:hypothetical protein